jgi:hypothetical protein
MTTVNSPDIMITNHGSLWTFRPLTEAAGLWLDENLMEGEALWNGGEIAVEPRCAFDLAEAMKDDGLVLGAPDGRTS